MTDSKSESGDEVTVVVQPGAAEPYGNGVSVYHLICDVLGLCPKYRPHRNQDAMTVARLLSKIIKARLCRRRKGGPRGQLRWEFDSADNYEIALSMLDHEPGAFRFQ